MVKNKEMYVEFMEENKNEFLKVGLWREATAHSPVITIVQYMYYNYC